MKKHMTKAERKQAAAGAIFEVKAPKKKFQTPGKKYDMVGKKFDPLTRRYL
jgi:hypothetical protein